MKPTSVTKFFHNAVVSIALSALVTAPMLAHAGPQAAPVVSPQAPAVQQAPQTQTQQLELIEKMQLADVSNETAGEVRGAQWVQVGKWVLSNMAWELVSSTFVNYPNVLFGHKDCYFSSTAASTPMYCIWS